MKKVALFVLLTSSLQLSAITSNMTHRIMSTSPLLYKMIDYSKRQTSYEIEPIFSSMYDSQHTISNLTPLGKQTLTFDQQGQGDVNPTWINLMSNNTQANYNSQVTFTPNLTESGALLHWYNKFEKTFIDIRTALVQCKSEIEINEVGGGNGLNTDVGNAQQAFTQSSWDYGKIGKSNHVVGLDNIEIKFGGISRATSNSSAYNMFISGFGLIEAPTGTGTKSEWLFEPQVGSNHWGLGFGFESLVSLDDSLKFMIAGNYRYSAPAWETRSFDLLGNGSWSRYLSVQDTYGLPTAPATLGLPGINYFTQQAYIDGRSQVNFYTRLQKHFKSYYFELSYNFFCIQKETIGAIKNINPNYGIYALTGSSGGSGGVTTSNSATINQDLTTLDPIGAPIAITTDRFDKLSAAAGSYATNTLSTRLEIKNNNVIYGFGASIEAAQSASAISSWAVWAKFEYLFNNTPTNDINIDFPSELYKLDSNTIDNTYHPVNINETELPDKESFEFLDSNKSIYNEDVIDALQADLNVSSQDLFNKEINHNINLQRKHITPIPLEELEEELNPTIIVKPPTTLFKKEDEITIPDEDDLEDDLDDEEFEDAPEPQSIATTPIASISTKDLEEELNSRKTIKPNEKIIPESSPTVPIAIEDLKDELNLTNTTKQPATLFKKEDIKIISDENNLNNESTIKETSQPQDTTTPAVNETIKVEPLDVIKEQPSAMFIPTSKIISSPIETSQTTPLQVKIEPIQQAEKIMESTNSKLSNRKKASIVETIKAESMSQAKPTDAIESKTIDVQSLYIDKEEPSSSEIISSPVETPNINKAQTKIEPIKEAKKIEQNVNEKISNRKKAAIAEQVKSEPIPEDEVLQLLNQGKVNKKNIIQEEESLKRNEEPTPIKIAEQANLTAQSIPTIISSPVEDSQIISIPVKTEPIKEAKEIEYNHDTSLKKLPKKKSAVDIIKAEPMPENEALKFVNPTQANINNSISEEDILKKLDSTK